MSPGFRGLSLGETAAPSTSSTALPASAARAPFKPRKPDAMLAWAAKETRDAMTPSFKLWYDAYVDCLAGLRLRNSLTAGAAPAGRGEASPGGRWS